MTLHARGAGRPRTDHRRPATREDLVRTTAWRLVVVGCGAAGFLGALSGGDVASKLEALSQLASLAVVVVYGGLTAYPFLTGRRFHEPRSPWWRGAIAVTLLLVMVVYQALLDGDLGAPYSLFEHLVTPLVVAVDVLVVGRNLLNASWWSTLTWLAFPLAYLVYYNLARLDVYSFPLLVDDPDFLDYLPGLLGGTVVAAAALVGVGRLRR